MADALAPHGYAEPSVPDDADLVILNTCHIREKAAEKVYSELGRLQQLRRRRQAARRRSGDRRRGLRRPGRGRRAAGARAAGRHRGRAAGLPPAARAAPSPRPQPQRRARHRLSAREQVRPPARGAGGGARRLRLPDRAGGLRQVLHLLRRPLHARRRGVATGGGDPRRGPAPGRRRRARDHPARPERQRLSRRRARRRGVGPRAPHPGAGGARGPAADPLHHLASARPRRLADRRAPRGGKADALPPPAGAVGLGWRAARDEPAPHRRRLPPRRRAPAARAARHRALRRLHRRLSGRERGRFPGHPRAGRGDRLRPGVLVQVQPATGHAGGHPARPGQGPGQERAAGRAAGPARAAERGLPGGDGRPGAAGAAWSGRAAIPVSWSAGRLTCRRCTSPRRGRSRAI